MKVTIFRKLLLWFFLVGFIPFFLFSVFTYNHSADLLEAQTYQSMEVYADKVQKDLLGFFRERSADLIILSKSSKVKSYFNNFAINEAGDFAGEFRGFMQEFAIQKDMANVVLVDSFNNIVFSITDEIAKDFKLNGKSFSDTGLGRACAASGEQLSAYLSDYEIFGHKKQWSAFLVAPVFFDNIFHGYVCAQFDQSLIERLTRNTIGFGETGEVVLAIKEGNDLLVINSLKNRKGSAFNMRLRNSGLDLPIFEAAKGIEKTGVGFDYRNKRVLATSRYLTIPRWCMVVKMDYDEVFGTIFELRDKFIFAGLLVALLVILLSRFASTHLSQPVENLTECLSRWSDGELGTRPKVDSQDELGQLSRVMSQVLDDIQAAEKSKNQEAWLRNQIAQIGQKISVATTLEELCDILLNSLLTSLECQCGTVFVVEGAGLILKSQIPDSLVPRNMNNLEMGEGLIGQVAKDKCIKHLKDIPESYYRISSTLGQTSPREVLIVPVIMNNEVLAVMELGNLKEFSRLHTELIDRLLNTCALAINARITAGRG